MSQHKQNTAVGPQQTTVGTNEEPDLGENLVLLRSGVESVTFFPESFGKIGQKVEDQTQNKLCCTKVECLWKTQTLQCPLVKHL